MTETLEWYAKRGLLRAKDEPEAKNKERLSAGRKLAQAGLVTRRAGSAEGGYGDLAAHTKPKGAQVGGLTNVEMSASKSQAVERMLHLAPPRSVDALIDVCFRDQLVGKPMMERLRCGLDAIAQNA